MTAAERAVLRIREEMAERKISQRDLAETLSCSQGRIAKILNGGVRLTVNDLDTLAKAVGLYLTEVVRDRGLEFSAELTPTELRVLERLRRRPNVLHAVLLMTDLGPLTEPTPPVQKRQRRGRPLTSELTKR